MGSGVVPADLFKRCGVPPLLFAGRDQLIPRQIALRMGNELSRMQGDPSACLHMAARQHVLDYGEIGARILEGPTLADSLAALTRGIKLIQSGTEIRVENTPREARLVISSVGESEEDPTLHLQTATAWVYRAACLAGLPGGVAVRLKGPRPRLEDECEQFFGPNLSFEAGRYEVIVDRGLLESPAPRGGPAPASAPCPNFGADPIEAAQAVMHEVSERLSRGRPTVDRIADGFGISTRSLQRWLKRSGLPFEEIVDNARQARTYELMTGGRHAIIEIAFLVGYSDQAHFIRAFRRWTGMTPGAYRRAIAAFVPAG